MVEKLDAKTLRRHKGISFVGITTVFFCHDGAGRFVLAKRGQGARDEQGTWDPGAGGLKWGIDPEDNVRREVMEEFGAMVKQIDFLGYRSPHRQLADGTPTHWLALDFAVLVNHDEVCLNEPEVFDDLGWFTLETLPSPMHSQWPVFEQAYAKRLRRLLA